MRIILDTNILVAAMRSPSGASAKIADLVLRGELDVAASTALGLEYEAVCLRPEHLEAARADAGAARNFVDAMLAQMSETSIDFAYRPQTPDPADDLVLEAAINAGAEIIVTFNMRDLATPAARFGVRTMLPFDFLRTLDRRS